MANENIYPPLRFKLQGRPVNYTPEELWEKFGEYVQWAKDNPIVLGASETSTNAEGKSWDKDTQRQIPRLVSIGGFLVFIGEDDSWWSKLDNRREGEKYVRVKNYIRRYCENYQKEMASANIFNANIISRLLGLADRKEVKADGLNIVVRNDKEKEAIKELIDR